MNQISRPFMSGCSRWTMPSERTTKQKLDRYLVDSDATNANVLSTKALLAIQGLANRLAASSVLAFHGAVWNRQQTLEKEVTDRTRQKNFICKACW